MAKLKLAGAALNQTPLDWTGNLMHIKEAIENARTSQVDILCLPELCITGYGCEDLFLSDWLYKKAYECLLEVIPWTKDIVVAVGLPFKYEGQNFNVAVVIDNQQVLGIYAKQNMALDGVHYEPRWFKPWPRDVESTVLIGDQTVPIGDITFKLNGIHTGFEICEDAWRKDRPACRLYEKGVELILNPSASHFAIGKTLDREKLVVDSSKNFHCTYVYANLLGNEAGRMIYDGEILIARHGYLLARNNWLSFKNVNLISHDVDFESEVQPLQANDYPRDKNTEFVKASSLALFDYLRKSRSKGYVLSLSGGADSTTCAILVSEMVKRGIEELGTKHFIQKIGLEKELKGCLTSSEKESRKNIVGKLLHCAYQGTKNSSKETLNSARELSQDIGATFHSWLIDEEVSGYTEKVEKVLNRKLSWEKDDIALQNIQARARSPIIWMLANIENALLITTSNRSEGDVGYTTMDGDTSGSIAPIAAIDKHFIIQWLKWAEKALEYPSLHYVNNLKPSAELRPLASTQTDEDDLMPYHILVEIEYLAIRDHRSPQEVLDALSKKELESRELLIQHIKKFYRLWARNQWKRERIAPAFHLDEFNVDPRTWCRFPILSNGFQEELDALK